MQYNFTMQIIQTVQNCKSSIFLGINIDKKAPTRNSKMRVWEK